MAISGDMITIALYGFLKNFCPDGFYISNILIGPGKNLTLAQVFLDDGHFDFSHPQTTEEVYPMLPYSNLLLTLVALLVTDILQYKTIIVTGAIASVFNKVFLFWGTSIVHMQIMQLLFGMYRATQVAYRTYIYTKVRKEKYQRATAVVHITPKMGTLASAVVAQLLLSTNTVTLDTLIQMSFVGLLLSVLTAIALPSVEGTAFSSETPSDLKGIKVSASDKYRRAVQLLWLEFKGVLTNLYVLKWCVWWVLANAAYPLITDCYVQVLWNEISGEKNTIYNAGVDAIYACFSSLVCFFIGRLHIDWHRHGDSVFALFTLVKATAIIMSAYTDSMITSYVLYIIISSIYDLMMVISNSQVALQMKNDSFGLIFGINTFMALILQSILTYVLTSKKALALPIRVQFSTIGTCFVLLGVVCSIKAIYSSISMYRALRLKKKVKPDVVVSVTKSSECKQSSILPEETRTHSCTSI